MSIISKITIEDGGTELHSAAFSRQTICGSVSVSAYGYSTRMNIVWISLPHGDAPE